MGDAKPLATLLKNRQALYAFLSGIYLHEVDEKQLGALRALALPEDTGSAALDEGYRLLAGWLAQAGDAAVEDLAVDYARVFLAAGMAQGSAAFPYQSVYTGRGRQFGQPCESEVAALYAEKGLAPNPAGYRVPADHLGLELGFMAHLCGLALAALEAGDGPALAACAAEQRDFLEKYLLSWAEGFCRDLGRHAETGFYKAVAKLTWGFMEQEQALAEMGDEPWDIG